MAVARTRKEDYVLYLPGQVALSTVKLLQGLESGFD